MEMSGRAVLPQIGRGGSRGDWRSRRAIGSACDSWGGLAVVVVVVDEEQSGEAVGLVKQRTWLAGRRAQRGEIERSNLLCPRMEKSKDKVELPYRRGSYKRGPECRFNGEPGAFSLRAPNKLVWMAGGSIMLYYTVSYAYRYRTLDPDRLCYKRYDRPTDKNRVL